VASSKLGCPTIIRITPLKKQMLEVDGD